MSWRRASTDFLFATALAVLLWFAYRPSFAGGFVLDDTVSIVDNPSIRTLWPITSPPVGGPTGGRPVANFTLALNYAVGGEAPPGYRLANLGLHWAAALVLFALARRTLLLPVVRPRFGSVATPLAAMAALWWALHPVQTNAVAYIAQRTELLMAFFYLLTLYCFVRGATGSPRIWHPLAVACCTLGMGSKEVMVTAPVLVWLFDRVFLAGGWRDALRQRRRLYLGLAASWLVLVGLMATSELTKRGAGFGVAVAPLDYLLTETRVVLRYVGLGAWPQPLIFDHGWEFAGSLREVWPHALGLAALCAVTLSALRRSPATAFAGVWFLVVLLPTSSFVPVGEQPMAESRLYLPLASLAVLLGAGAFAVFGRKTWLPLGIGLVALSVVAGHRTRVYGDPLGLWTDTVEKKPGNARAYRWLGDLLFMAGRVDEAIAALQTAVRLKPDYVDSHCNLGPYLTAAGRADEALVSLATALRLKPDYPQAYYNLGNAQVARRDLAAAEAAFDRALQLAPDHAKAHNNLAILLGTAGRFEAAISHYQAALTLNPRFAEARHNLGVAHAALGEKLAAAGRHADAVKQFEAGVNVAPSVPEAWGRLAQALLLAGRVADAISTAQQAAALHPRSAALHLALGNILLSASRPAEAAASYTTALQLAPDDPEAHNNFGVLHLRLGRPDVAREHFLTALRLRPDYAEARENLHLVAASPAR
ncbi:MAG: tetratricopeptide repeat protein [Verrucomicrobia bacterium]|nr:tetratricopeptide repeat protein [Verrucomicrobiota bacterium]